MPLTAGSRLGAYDIIALLGAGGMGEVYRARDSKLNRDVALKILPVAFASAPDRLARFTREAQTLASLNHPHIAAIYGLEESSDVHALVMELVEGEDLSERIARGPIPLDEALPIAKQIADALEAAHEQGIIHRDLKPANIKLRANGTVKVLDFGLAKLTERADPGAPPTGERSQSPTITSPAMMTGVGVILGTAAYMSPEQARGKTVDRGADVWALGCVVYEMLTGQRAFGGEDVAETLANVINKEPAWEALPTAVPTHVRQTLAVCLRKEPRQRASDIHDVWLALEGAFGTPPLNADAPMVRAKSHRATIGAVALLATAVIAAAVTWYVMRPAAPVVVRTMITTSGSSGLSLQGGDRDIAITPDGSRIVYRGNNQLLVRSMSQLEPIVLNALGEPHGVFISPDGHWVGYFDGSKSLKRVAIAGGPPLMITAVGGLARGATWGPDGSIIFATFSLASGLQRVPAGGGEATILTTPNREHGEIDHLWPEFLPGGKAVLFTITPATGSIEDSQIAVLDLNTGASKVLVNGGSHARFLSTGHLVYAVAGTMRAVAFDLQKLEVIGTPTPALEGVVTTGSGAADLDVASNGSLVYVPGGVVGSSRQTIVSVDRQGLASPLPGLPVDSYRDVRLSPNGAQLALATDGDIWTYEFARGTRSKLTTNPAPDFGPLWTQNGERIVFMSRRAGFPELFWRPADGSGTDEKILTRGKELVDLRANGWTQDGRQLLITDVPTTNLSAVWQVSIDSASEPKVLLKSEFNHDFAAVSPDGHWLAYRSTVSGQTEIYVERYPELGGRRTISTGGGRMPVWARDGTELFYGTQDGREWYAVPVRPGPNPFGSPQLLFKFPAFVAQGGRPFDVGPDGRFVMIASDQTDTDSGASSNIVVVQNWFEELKRLVPTK